VTSAGVELAAATTHCRGRQAKQLAMCVAGAGSKASSVPRPGRRDTPLHQLTGCTSVPMFFLPPPAMVRRVARSSRGSGKGAVPRSPRHLPATPCAPRQFPEPVGKFGYVPRRTGFTSGPGGHAHNETKQSTIYAAAAKARPSRHGLVCRASDGLCVASAKLCCAAGRTRPGHTRPGRLLSPFSY
jgi:hypothetical protein